MPKFSVSKTVTESPENRADATSVATTRKAAAQPRAIRTAYHPRISVVLPRVKKIPRREPLIMRTQAVQEDLAIPATFVILQTSRFDASGAGIWTMCVWKVQGTNQAEKQWESTIVLSVI